MKHAIRKQTTSATTPEAKGELVSVHLTYAEASAECTKGHYVCEHEEPILPGSDDQVKHPF